jgi:hypothetical protein
MKSASTPDPIAPQHRIGMPTLMLRSVCVGTATMVVATCVCVFVEILVAVHSIPQTEIGGGEVGWDLVTLVRNIPVGWLFLPLAVFAAGFAFGFRYFSRSLKGE